jgi:hypothetical protein
MKLKTCDENKHIKNKAWNEFLKKMFQDCHSLTLTNFVVSITIFKPLFFHYVTSFVLDVTTDAKQLQLLMVLVELDNTVY